MHLQQRYSLLAFVTTSAELRYVTQVQLIAVTAASKTSGAPEVRQPEIANCANDLSVSLQGTKAKSSGALPLPKPRAVAEAVCGAPAQAQAAAAEQKAAYQNDEENADLASASDWEVCV